MKVLKDILFGVKPKSIHGDRSLRISGLCFDSRFVEKGNLFIAVKGLTVDGHNFIIEAVESGAIAIICEFVPDGIPDRIVTVEVENSAEAIGLCASNFYERPSEKLSLVGITGTNGKTTVATICHDLFTGLGYTTGLLSTIENRIDSRKIDSQYTTADAIQINRLIAQMVEEGCTHCFMEVSSHALTQHRTTGLSFAGGVFTNISHDHLDYHKTFDEYIKAKKLLFDGLPSKAFALVNNDDKRGMLMLQNTKAEKKKFAIKSMANFKIKILHNSLEGMELDFNGTHTWFKLVGGFNAYNLIAAYSIAILLGEDEMQILKILSTLGRVNGRFESVKNGSEIIALVDYAHTPDALENVLKTINELRTKNEMLVTVVGCGGNRDKKKRPIMARIAAKFSNKLILTSDNPRRENPTDILNEMMAGIPKSLEKNTMVIADRREAIRTACNLVSPKDILLVAGKGHETYQEINGIRHHFDDKEILTEMLN